MVEEVVEGILFEASEADRGPVFVIDERVVRGEEDPRRKSIRSVAPLRTLFRRQVTG